jgi:hypothetical protein
MQINTDIFFCHSCERRRAVFLISHKKKNGPRKTLRMQTKTGSSGKFVGKKVKP